MIMALTPENLETTSNSKEFACDGKGAIAGNPEPTPEKGSVDKVADAHGLGSQPGDEIGLQKNLRQRDESRWELNTESAQR